MAPQNRNLLCLDIDGVLNPSTDVSDYSGCGIPFEAYLQGRPHLLRWAPLLAATLDGTQCEILVHSTWREHLLDADLRRLLDPGGLSSRFIGSAPRGLPREEAILSVCDRMKISLQEIVVLDDAYEEFSVLRSRLIVCNPLLGVSDPAVRHRLREALDSNSPTDFPDGYSEPTVRTSLAEQERLR